MKLTFHDAGAHQKHERKSQNTGKLFKSANPTTPEEAASVAAAVANSIIQTR